MRSISNSSYVCGKNNHAIGLYYAAALTMLIFIARDAVGAITFNPHANGNYEYDSNIFLINRNQPARVDNDGEARFEDSFISYGGGIDVVGAWGENKLALNTNISHYSYSHFSDLDRDDKLVSLGLDWVATNKINGRLTGRYAQNQTSFVDLTNAQTNVTSYIQTDRVLGLTINYQLYSKLRANLDSGYSRRSVPWRGPSATYDLQQLPVAFGVTYGGDAKLTVGASIETNKGDYYRTGVDVAGFTQTAYRANMNYKFSDRTTLSAAIGQAEYQQQNLNSSGTIGSLAFSQQLTGKTVYYLRYDHSLDAYVYSGGSQTSDTYTAGVTWQALQKIAISASYGQTNADIRAGFLNLGLGIFDQDRQEKLRTTQVSLTYNILRWMTFNPYYRNQHRTSNVEVYGFDNEAYGANVEVHFR